MDAMKKIFCCDRSVDDDGHRVWLIEKDLESNEKDLELVAEVLVGDHVQVNTADKLDGLSTLHDSKLSPEKDLELVAEVLVDDPVNVNFPDELDGLNALHDTSLSPVKDLVREEKDLDPEKDLEPEKEALVDDPAIINFAAKLDGLNALHDTSLSPDKDLVREEKDLDPEKDLEPEKEALVDDPVIINFAAKLDGLNALHDTSLSPVKDLVREEKDLDPEKDLEPEKKVLVGDHVKVNFADSHAGHNTLLHGAVTYGYVDTVRLLLEKGAEVSSKNTAGETPLHVAVSRGYYDIVKVLLDKGADTNAIDSRGETPLHVAQAKAFYEIVALLENKVDKVTNTADEASLHEAVAEGNVKNVELFLNKETDVTVKNAAGETPLHVAVRKGSICIVNFFLTKYPDVINVKNATGDTLLHLVAGQRTAKRNKVTVSLLKLLIQYNPNVNSKNDKGKTPLHFAVEQSAKSVVKLLLENKADVTIKAGDESPLDLAKKIGNQDIIKLLSTTQGQASHSKAYRPETYKTSGAKTSSHGYLFHLRLLLCFLLRAMNNSYVFRMGTEVDEAQQFDDLVFEYQDKKSDIERKLFLQAKHVQDNDKMIVISELLSNKAKAPFSLLKYFKSYLKLKETFGLEADKIDLAICSNIHLSLDKDCRMTEAGSTRLLSFIELPETYKEFFKEGKCYKLVTDDETLALLSSEYQKYINPNTEEEQQEHNASDGSVVPLSLKQEFWDFKTFLNNLIFVVKQPVDEEKIKSELMAVLCKKFKDINLLYDSFYMKMYYWYMKEEGTYLTGDLVKNWIQTIVNDLDIVSISARTKVYAEKLLTSPVAFNGIRVEGLLEMISNHNIVHLASPKGTKLTAILVAQTLSQSDNYKLDDGFIFVRLNSLLLNIAQVTNAFASSVNNDLLVIDCLSTAKNRSESGRKLTNLSTELMRIVSGNPKKKLVLIAPEDHPLPAIFKDRTRPNVTSVFRDLTPDSQSKLLATSVTVQGERVELSQVIDKDDKDLLDLVPLEDLISDEGLVIERELPPSPGFNESFYIERSMINHIAINDEIFQDVSQKRFNDHIAKTELEFQKLSSSHPSSNIHWIKEENSRFIWVQSKGELNDLHRYIDRSNSQSCSEDLFLESVKDQRLVIISETAGMGKSTILCHISKQIKENHPGKIISRVDLNNFSEVLRKRKSGKSDKSSALDFFYNSLITTRTPLVKELLKRKGKVVLLFDGFDEISPDYDDIVIDLIQEIRKDTEAQIWITTRPFMREKLENMLHQFSCSLQPFSEENQFDFLTKYWTHMLEKDVDRTRLKSYALALVQQLSTSISDIEREFTGIPLQVRMLAECFMDKVSGSSAPDLGDQFRIVDLYDTFINNKYEIFFNEKNNVDSSKVGEKENQNMVKASYKKIHQWYACCLLFSKEKTQRLFPSLCPDDSLVSNVNRIGIVNIINDAPHFVHRTFAEYLCADFVMDFLKAQQCDEIIDFVLTELLTNKTYLVFRAFLNGLLIKQKPSGDALSLFGKRMETFYSVKHDKVGRIFYLTAKECNQNILEYLCNALQDHASTLRKLMCCRFDKQITMLHAAATGGHDNVIQTLLRRSRDVMDGNKDLLRDMLLAVDRHWTTALHAAATGGHDNVVQTLLSWSVDIMNGDKDLVRDMLLAVDGGGKTALHQAATGGHDNVIQTLLSWLLDILNRDEDLAKMLLVVDGDGSTPLHSAATGGHDNVIQTLLSRSRDVMVGDKYLVSEMLLSGDGVRGTALHVAATGAFDNVIQTLLNRSRGIMVGDKYLVRKMLLAVGENGNTALHVAVTGGHDNVTKTLLSCTRDISDGDKDLARDMLLAVDRNERTALHLATTGGLDATIKTLLSWSRDVVDVDSNVVKYMLLAIDRYGRTALHWAAKGESDHVIQTLLTCTRDIMDGDKDLVRKMPFTVEERGKIALHWVAADVQDNLFKTLLSCTCDIVDANKDLLRKMLFAVDVDGRTALHLAAKDGHDNVIQTLLSWYRDIMNGDKELVRGMLLAVDKDRRRILHVVATSELDIVVQTLFKWTRANLDQGQAIGKRLLLTVDKQKKVALHWASYLGHVKVVRILLQWPCENLDHGVATLKDMVLAVHEDKKTALHEAVYHGRIGVVKTLLQTTRDMLGERTLQLMLAMRDKEGMTALDRAVYNEETETADYVRGFDAEPTFDKQWKLALHWAAYREYDNVVQVLVQWSCETLSQGQTLVKDMLSAVGDDGDTALHDEVWRGHDNVNQSLLQWPCDDLDQGQTLVNEMMITAKKLGKVELHWAAFIGRNNMTHTLLLCPFFDLDQGHMKVKEMLSAVDNQGRAALHRAAYYGRNKAIQTLLQWRWVNLEQGQTLVKEMLLAVDIQKKVALHWAAFHGHNNVVQTLLQWPCENLDHGLAIVKDMVLAVHEDQKTALHEAVCFGHDNVVQTLLQTTRSMLGEQTLQLLLATRDHVRRTALDIAVYKSHTASTDLLRFAAKRS